MLLFFDDCGQRLRRLKEKKQRANETQNLAQHLDTSEPHEASQDGRGRRRGKVSEGQCRRSIYQPCRHAGARPELLLMPPPALRGSTVGCCSCSGGAGQTSRVALEEIESPDSLMAICCSRLTSRAHRGSQCSTPFLQIHGRLRLLSRPHLG